MDYHTIRIAFVGFIFAILMLTVQTAFANHQPGTVIRTGTYCTTRCMNGGNYCTTSCM